MFQKNCRYPKFPARRHELFRIPATVVKPLRNLAHNPPCSLFSSVFSVIRFFSTGAGAPSKLRLGGHEAIVPAPPELFFADLLSKIACQAPK